MLRRERADSPGAAFTIEVAIPRTNAELECVEVAEALAAQRLIELASAADEGSATEQIEPAARRGCRRAG